MSERPRPKAMREFFARAEQQRGESWDVSRPSRGLGDAVAKLTHATGIDRLVKKVAGGRDCGCQRRQEKLNKMFPIKSARV